MKTKTKTSARKTARDPMVDLLGQLPAESAARLAQVLNEALAKKVDEKP